MVSRTRVNLALHPPRPRRPRRSRRLNPPRRPGELSGPILLEPGKSHIACLKVASDNISTTAIARLLCRQYAKKEGEVDVLPLENGAYGVGGSGVGAGEVEGECVAGGVWYWSGARDGSVCEAEGRGA